MSRTIFQFNAPVPGSKGPVCQGCSSHAKAQLNRNGLKVKHRPSAMSMLQFKSPVQWSSPAQISNPVQGSRSDFQGSGFTWMKLVRVLQVYCSSLAHCFSDVCLSSLPSHRNHRTLTLSVFSASVPNLLSSSSRTCWIQSLIIREVARFRFLQCMVSQCSSTRRRLLATLTQRMPVALPLEGTQRHRPLHLRVHCTRPSTSRRLFPALSTNQPDPCSSRCRPQGRRHLCLQSDKIRQ